MQQFTKVLMALFIALGLTACDMMSNRDAGALTGGLVGGAVGSQFGRGRGQVLATVGGAVVGSMIGSNIGQTMDDVDRMKMNKVLEKTKTHESYAWTNPDTHNRYRVKPIRTYHHHGKPCREYVTEAWIDGHRQQIHGTACRNSDGQWRALS